MLEVNDLWVEVHGKQILKGMNLRINTGETHILLGKNGSGKTTLLLTLMGFSGYKIINGRIRFKDVDITNLPTHERAKLGIGISFQRPPTLHGVRLRDMLSICGNGSGRNEILATQYNFANFLDREVNLGFSGGEIKKSELLQLLAQNPDLVLLDEPESGVDIENLNVIGLMIKNLLQKDLKRHRQKSGLIISHTGFILNYLEADKGHILLDGRIHCQGNPREIFQEIQRCGYEECVRCRK